MLIDLLYYNYFVWFILMKFIANCGVILVHTL